MTMPQDHLCFGLTQTMIVREHGADVGACSREQIDVSFATHRRALALLRRLHLLGLHVHAVVARNLVAAEDGSLKPFSKEIKALLSWNSQRCV